MPDQSDQTSPKYNSGPIQQPNPPGQASPFLPADLSQFGATKPSSAGGVQKEQEPVPTQDVGSIEEIASDVELEPEVETAGVEKRSETISLPADVKEMGVSAIGPTQPISPPATTVQLPLTDDQIEVGLHAQIISSLRWLAEWCIRQLKKAHYHLKVIAGHALRERD